MHWILCVTAWDWIQMSDSQLISYWIMNSLTKTSKMTSSSYSHCYKTKTKNTSTILLFRGEHHRIWLICSQNRTPQIKIVMLKQKMIFSRSIQCLKRLRKEAKEKTLQHWTQPKVSSFIMRFLKCKEVR